MLRWRPPGRRRRSARPGGDGRSRSCRSTRSVRSCVRRQRARRRRTQGARGEPVSPHVGEINCAQFRTFAHNSAHLRTIPHICAQFRTISHMMEGFGRPARGRRPCESGARPGARRDSRCGGCSDRVRGARRRGGRNGRPPRGGAGGRWRPWIRPRREAVSMGQLKRRNGVSGRGAWSAPGTSRRRDTSRPRSAAPWAGSAATDEWRGRTLRPRRFGQASDSQPAASGARRPGPPSQAQGGVGDRR